MRPQTPTCLCPHVHDHVHRHGASLPAAPPGTEQLGLPQVDEASNVEARKIDETLRASRALRVLTGLLWSGLVWRWSGCLAWLGLARLEIRRSPPPASSQGPSICSVVNVHASLHELCHIQPQFIQKGLLLITQL